jgi:hypothetical protein
MLLLLWGWVGAWAEKGQTGFESQPRGQVTEFEVAWVDASGRHEVAFTLPSEEVRADRQEETWLPRREMWEAAAKAVRQYGRDLPRVKITAQIEDGGLRIGAEGTGDVRGALQQAEVVRDEAIDTWLAQNRFMRMKNGSLSFDHAALVVDYTDDLASVASALRQGTSSEREFVERALSFVQTIPYEARKRKGGDPGYRRPLALIARNRGDCDSKSVLFLGIVHAELPSVPLAVLYVEDHALVGVGLEAQAGDKSFSFEGQRLLYAEPVGPAQLPLGGKVPAAHRKGRAEVHLVR